jgi:hypothetical protein
MTTYMLGYEAKLILDLDGVPFDATDLLNLSPVFRDDVGWSINALRLLRAITAEREVRRRVAAATTTMEITEEELRLAVMTWPGPLADGHLRTLSAEDLVAHILERLRKDRP